MRDPLFSNGAAIYGTAAHRLSVAAGAASLGLATVLAGDLFDVCHHAAECDVDASAFDGFKRVRKGEQIEVDAEELTTLLEALTGGPTDEEEQVEETTAKPGKAKAAKQPKAKAAKPPKAKPEHDPLAEILGDEEGQTTGEGE